MKSPRLDLAGFHRKILMDDMMQAVGVDLLDVIDLDGGQSYIRGRANCLACSCTSVCRDWLAAQTDGAPQDFCPNADLFRRVKGGAC